MAPVLAADEITMTYLGQQGSLEALEGDDTIDVFGPVDASVWFAVRGGGPGASDVLNLLGAPATVETVTIGLDSANPTEQDVTGLESFFRARHQMGCPLTNNTEHVQIEGVAQAAFGQRLSNQGRLWLDAGRVSLL